MTRSFPARFHGAFLALALAQAAVPSEDPDARAWTWSDFPVFVWRERYRGKPLPDELAAPFGGVILMREEPSDWARERGLAYLVWNVAGRDALHLDADEAWRAKVERWIETRDEKLLVREPCLNDPATVKALEGTLKRTLALHGEHPGLGFVLGDEVSLTPNGDPFDLCRCERCDSLWRDYAKQHDLPERAPLTDEVRLALLEEDTSALGAWLARRRFDQERMADLLAPLADQARTAGEHLAVGLLGIGDRTVFGGVSPERVLPSFDFVEFYPTGGMRELYFKTRGSYRRGRRALGTLFPQEETPAGVAWLAWEHWLRGENGLVLWNDESLERLPAHCERLAETVQRIRAVPSEFSDEPYPRFENNIAVIHDADSIALSWLRDALLDGPTWPRRRAGYQQQNGTRERKVRSWLRLLEDCGYLPGVLRLSDILNARWYWRVLILPEVLALDPKDIRILEGHLDRGGFLVVDGRLGWVDRSGRPLQQDVIDQLRARAPEHVLMAPPGVASYLETRFETNSSGAVRSFVHRIASNAGISDRLPPLQISPSCELPWLIATRGRWNPGHPCMAPPDAWLVTMLPNCATPEERRSRLRDLPLDVRTPEGWDIEWLHPSDGAFLPAGDAAVYVLTPPSR